MRDIVGTGGRFQSQFSVVDSTVRAAVASGQCPARNRAPGARRRGRFLASAAAMTLVAASFAEAQTFSGTWTSTAGSGSWGTAGNWSGGTIASGQAGLADFSTLALPSDQTVVLNTARTIGVLRFGDANTTPTYNWTVSNGGTAANTLTLQGTDYANAGRPVINVVNGTTTISANIIQGNAAGSQTTQWVKAGNGTLVITGTIAGPSGNGFGGLAIQGGTAVSPSTVTYNSPTMNYGSIDNTGTNFFGYKNTVIAAGSGENGVWNIQAGTISTAFLQLGANGGNGFGSATLNLSGGRLRTSGVQTADNTGANAVLNVSGGELAVVTNNGTAGFVRAGGFNNRPTTLTLSGTGRVSFYSDTGTTPLTNLGGNGGWNLNGGGTSFINLNGGTLSIPRFTWTAPGGGQGGGNGSLLFNGGILQTTAASANFLLTGTISTSVSTGGTLIDTNGNAVTIGNNLAHDPLLGSTLDGGLTKSGAGVLTLTGNSGYTGTTTVNAGTLKISENTLASQTYVVATGATLEYSLSGGGRSQTMTSLTGGGTFVKSGTSSLSLPLLGTVNFTAGGLIDVQGGTLQASDFQQSTPNWSSNRGGLNIASGATFDAYRGDVTVDALTGSGTYRAGYFGTRTLTVGANNSSSTFGGSIQNSGTGGAAAIAGLIKVGTGALTLTASSGYTAGTTISGGTIIMGNANALGAGGVNLKGGVLAGSGTVSSLFQDVSNPAGSGISPGTGVGSITTASLTLNSNVTLTLEVQGTAGSGVTNGNDVVNVTGGTVVLGNARLNILSLAPFVANYEGGQTFTIVNNTGSGSISGLFATLAGTVLNNGDRFDTAGTRFQINYGSGAGGDVVLTTVPEPTSLVGLIGLAGLAARRRRAGAK